MKARVKDSWFYSMNKIANVFGPYLDNSLSSGWIYTDHSCIHDSNLSAFVECEQKSNSSNFLPQCFFSTEFTSILLGSYHLVWKHSCTTETRNLRTNQSAAQSCSFTCTFLCSEEPLATMAESVRTMYFRRKACLKIILCWKGLIQGYNTCGGPG